VVLLAFVSSLLLPPSEMGIDVFPTESAVGGRGQEGR